MLHNCDRSWRGLTRGLLAAVFAAAALSGMAAAPAYTHKWAGGDASAPNDFFTAANWRDGSGNVCSAAPDSTSVVYVPSDAASGVTVSRAFDVKDLHVGSAAKESGVVTLTIDHNDENVVRGDLHVYEYGIVEHAELAAGATKITDENRRVWIRVTGGVTVDKDGAINVSGKGYASKKGPGYLSNTAAHGGTFNVGYSYGSLTCPTNHGTGSMTRGGGVVRIDADGACTVNGSITSDGLKYTSYYSGAGGSVWITTAALSGSGTLSACGGWAQWGYSGSGGRLSVRLTQDTDFSAWKGTMKAVGGFSNDYNNRPAGPPGTVYLDPAGDGCTNATTIVSSEGVCTYAKGCSGYVELTARNASDRMGSLVVTNAGKVRLAAGDTVVLHGDLLSRNGWVVSVPEATIDFAGEETARLEGSNALCSVRCAAPGKTLTFGTAATDIFRLARGAKLTLEGTAESPVALNGAGGGTWKMNVPDNAVQDISHVTVSGSDASLGYAALAYASAEGSPAVTNWVFFGTAAGAAVTWTGAVDGNWFKGGNWSSGAVPGATAAVTIPDGLSAPYPTLSGKSVSVGALTVASGASLTLSGGHLAVANATTVAGALTFAGRERLACYGDVDFTGATVTAGEGEIYLGGTAAQTANLAGKAFCNVKIRKTGGSVNLTAAFAANDFDVMESDGITMTFAAGATFAFSEIHWSGVTLVSSVPGTKWALDVSGAPSVVGVTVSDSDATGKTIFADTTSKEGTAGSNANWSFGSLAQTWTGAGGNAKWETAANWEPAVVPGPTSRVEIAGAVTVTATKSVEVQNLTVGNGTHASTVTLQGGFACSDSVDVKNASTLNLDALSTVTNGVRVREGGKLSHTALPSNKEIYRVDLTCGSLQVDAGGAVDVTSRGYPKQTGPGFQGGWAGHGGAHAEAQCYGSVTCPTNHGSGAQYGPGSGAIKLTVKGTAQVDGRLCADTPELADSSYSSAGGSVWLTCATLTGAGAISANAGNVCWNWAGGGGRVAVWLSQARDFSAWHGTIEAHGGLSKFVTTHGPSGPGGTVYLHPNGDSPTNATLIVDAANRTARGGKGPTGYTVLNGTTCPEALGTVVVTNLGRVSVTSGATVDIQGDWLARTGWMSAVPGATLNFTGEGPSRIEGSNVFCSVTCTVPGKTLLFGTTNVDRVELVAQGRWTLKGTAGSPVTAKGEGDGMWKLGLPADGVTDVSHVTAAGSDASLGATVLAYDSTEGTPGTVNWVFVGAAPGATATWTGAVDADWKKAGNWSPEKVPAATSAVVIPAGLSTPYPVLSGTSASVGALELQTGASLALSGGNLAVAGQVTAAGTLTFAGSERLTLYGNASFTNATVTAGSGEVYLGGSAAQTVDFAGRTFNDVRVRKTGGSVTLADGFKAHDFDARETAGIALTFAAGKTCECEQIHWGGVTLRSSAPGTKWLLKATVSASVIGVTVSDSNATGLKIYADLTSTEGVAGSNVNWVFGSLAQTWTGTAGNGSWETAANWSPAVVPGATSRVEIVGSVTVMSTAKAQVQNLTVGDGTFASTVTFRNGLTCGDSLEVKNASAVNLDAASVVTNAVFVRNGGTIAHTALPGSQEIYRVDLTCGELQVDAGGAVDVTARGYPKQTGPGYQDGWAGHGGAYTEARCYGSVTCPTNHGSGAYYGPGGGAIKLTVKGTAQVDGRLCADTPELADYSYTAAGGSVWLTCATLTGAGAISANAGTACWNWAGGGGRVAVWLSQARDFSAWHGTIEAHGGLSGHVTTHGPSGPGGTVYLHPNGDSPTNATLIVDAANRTASGGKGPTGYTVLNGTTCPEALGTVVVTNLGCVRVTSGATVDIQGDWLARTGWMSAVPGATLNFTGEGPSRIEGSNVFCSVNCTTPGKTLLFGTTNVDRVELVSQGSLTLRGTAANPVAVKGADGGTWKLKLPGDAVTHVSHVTAAGSDASDGATVLAYDSTEGTPGTVNWVFFGNPPAETLTWTGKESDDWMTAENWSPERVPSASANVSIPYAERAPVLRGGNVSVGALTVAAGASLTLSGANLAVANAATVHGTVAFAGTERMTFYGDVTFASAATATGTAELYFGGNAAQTADLGGRTFHKAIVRKTGGTLTLASGFVAGDFDVRDTDGITLKFATGEEFAFTQIHWTGATLESTQPGTKWLLNVSGSASVVGVTVSDSDATGRKICADLTSKEGVEGSNVNWVFGSLAQTWTGEAADGKWETAANWSPAVVPGPTSRVEIAGTVTITSSAKAELQNLVVGDGTFASVVTFGKGMASGDSVDVLKGSTLNIDAPTAVSNLVQVRSGGKLSHSQACGIDLTCGEFLLDAGASVDTVGRGYVPQSGPGYRDLAASHGGGYAVDLCYGTFSSPTNIGSGSDRGYGGGAVKIAARERMAVEGDVLAGSADRLDGYYSGAGGSVWLTCPDLTGAGRIDASSGYTAWGWSGGGGRVAVYLTRAADFSSWKGTIAARGGDAGHPATHGPAGPAGTVYLRTADAKGAYPAVLVENGGVVQNNGAAFPLMPKRWSHPKTDYRDITLTVRDAGRVMLTDSITIRDLDFPTATGVINLQGNVLTVLSSKHRRGKRWAVANPGDDPYATHVEPGGTPEAPGRIEWRPEGTRIIVR